MPVVVCDMQLVFLSARATVFVRIPQTQHTSRVCDTWRVPRTSASNFSRFWLVQKAFYNMTLAQGECGMFLFVNGGGLKSARKKLGRREIMRFGAAEQVEGEGAHQTSLGAFALMETYLRNKSRSVIAAIEWRT